MYNVNSSVCPVQTELFFAFKYAFQLFIGICWNSRIQEDINKMVSDIILDKRRNIRYHYLAGLDMSSGYICLIEVF